MFNMEHSPVPGLKSARLDLRTALVLILVSILVRQFVRCLADAKC